MRGANERSFVLVHQHGADNVTKEGAVVLWQWEVKHFIKQSN